MALGVRSTEKIQALLGLALNPADAGSAVSTVTALSQAERESLLTIAFRNHVVIRGFQVLHTSYVKDGNQELADWTGKILTDEQTRIAKALPFLETICQELEKGGCPVTVLKSLDHVPDLGTDLDLYTTADSDAVIKVMTGVFKAHLEPRSAGDRLANKWNFVVPGLNETIEIHVQRLGQAGEHTSLAQRFVSRRITKQIGSHVFPVPALEETILAATFQRMYRHFFLRVCDIVNTVGFIEQGQINYRELNAIATRASVWSGVATYLTIVADYARDYAGKELDVPESVTKTALFGNKKLFCTRGPFLRIPMFPDVARLYTSQLAGTAFAGHLAAAFRLSLLPGLFSVAVVHGKLTGRDQGVW